MRRFVTAGTLALFVALFAGCSEQETQTPTEPDFGKKNKVTYVCADTEVALQQADLETTIVFQYLNNKAEKGALENVDNMARNICMDPPDLAAARNTYFKFEIEVNKQSEAKLRSGEAGRQEILAKARAFVSGVPYEPGFTIPPEALEEDGFVKAITPGDIAPGEWVDLLPDGENPEGALRVFYNSFPDNVGDVTLVGYRMPDDTPGEPDLPFGDLTVLPEIWFFDASVDPIPIQAGGAGVDRWVCVVEPFLVPFEQLVIARSLGDGEVELLEPPLYDDSPLNCDNAVLQMAIGPESPSWLQLAGLVLEPVISRLFGVTPAYAMYFKGTGLGGRGGSFSPHAPVDRESATIPDPVIAFDYMETSEVIPEEGEPYFVDRYYFNVTNWSDFPDFLFFEQSEEPCSANLTPSRTWLEIFDASNDSRIYGFCAFDSPDDLQSFWFGRAGTLPPASVYIELQDKITEAIYTSNTVSIPATSAFTLNLSVTGLGSVYVTGYDQPCSSTRGVTTLCSFGFTRLAWLELSAVPVAGESSDPVWTGCTAGDALGTCTVPLQSVMAVEATFPPLGPS